MCVQSRPFIFVYRMPAEWHEDVLAYPSKEHWLRWYKGDELFYNYIRNSSYITDDPAAAKLFFCTILHRSAIPLPWKAP